MGYIIGETTYPATWRACRSVVSNYNVAGGAPTFGDHNSAYPAGAKWLKTTAGNGLLRQQHLYGGQEIRFTQNTPPSPDSLNLPYFYDPYPAYLLGKTVTTSTSSFSIIAGHFTGGAAAGTGGTTPVLTIDDLENLT
jgi:hypothetical protein